MVFSKVRGTLQSFVACAGRAARRRLPAAGGLVFALAGFLAASEWAVIRGARGRIVNDPAASDTADVALVLGTAPIVHGRANFFYEARLDAAAELFRRGTVRALLVSGDNSRRDYDEPTDMKRDLIARGVPAERITCDYAGFSTLDSIERARGVFGQDRVIVVSQRFHLERALFLADAAGLEARGVAAADAPRFWALRTRAREVVARGKAVLDATLARGPRFLGPPEIVFLATTPVSDRTP